MIMHDGRIINDNGDKLYAKFKRLSCQYLHIAGARTAEVGDGQLLRAQLAFGHGRGRPRHVGGAAL